MGPKESAFLPVERIGWTSTLIALFICAVWGGNVVALKYGLSTFPPFWSAFWRMVPAVAAVGLWAWIRGIPLKPPRAEYFGLVSVSLMFSVQIATFNIGTDMTSPGYAIVLLTVHPVFANLIAHFFVPEDRITARRVVGMTIAFAGICGVFLGQPEERLARLPLWGNTIILVNASLLAARNVYTQRLLQTFDPVRTVFWQMMLSIPIFLVAGGLFEAPALQAVTWGAVAAILYQGVVIAGFCFVVWAILLERHSPGSVSMFAFSTPIFGLLLSALIFGEVITLRLISGTAFVTLGILVFTRRRPLFTANPTATEATP